MIDKGCSCGDSKGCGRCETYEPFTNIPCLICGKLRGQSPDMCNGHCNGEWIMYKLERIVRGLENKSRSTTPREPNK